MQVHQPKICLGFRVSLLGAKSKISQSRIVVPGDAPSERVSYTEIRLRWGITLTGSEPVPSDGLRVILRHASTICVHEPDARLAGRIALPEF
jgi:hypothetical protein